METFEFVAAKEDKGERLDRFLQKNLPGVSRSHVKTIIEEGGATVNGKVEKAGASLKENDKVVFNLPSPKNLSLEPENIPLDIVYEDDDIAVINKPQGMVVHPACGSENGTLVNALLYNLSSLSTINGVVRPGIVHEKRRGAQKPAIANPEKRREKILRRAAGREREGRSGHNKRARRAQPFRPKENGGCQGRQERRNSF